MPRKPPPAPARSAPRQKSAPQPARPNHRAPSGTGAKTPTVAGLRQEIDRLDRDLVGGLNQLVQHLNRRAEVVTRIGELKQAQGIEVWSPAREDEVITKVLGANHGPLPIDTLRLIFRELMSGSRSLQQPLRVSSLGPRYSYSHLAALAKFGHAVEHVPAGSIAAVFEEVNRRRVHLGLVPLENSTDGRIAETLDMFSRLPEIKIRAEVRLRVHHCLLGKGEQAMVRRVYSKDNAISQCRDWLGKNMPGAVIVPVVSTAAAAELAQREESAAAIASRAAAEGYQLKILAANIEDRANNTTRFAVISERSEERTGRDKTTLMMRLPNKPGSLVQAFRAFEKFDVNMTWVESFPLADSKEDSQSYAFFVDVIGHSQDDQIQKALAEARKKCERLDVLGSYPMSDSIDN